MHAAQYIAEGNKFTMPIARAALFALHRLPPVNEARLSARFDVTWNTADGDVPVAELVARAECFDGFISTVTDPLPIEVFRPGGRLRIVANFGVGVNLIDLDAARRAGVVVTNTPGVLTDCTADLTIALMLMTLRRLGEGERLARSGAWLGWRPTQLLGRRMSGKTLGIIGMGRIGQAVARRAGAGFGMRVLAAMHRPVPPPLPPGIAVEWCPLDELLSRSDVVSLHCPATPETAGLLDRRRLGLMRPDAILINTARGALIDEPALVAVLEAGRLGGAGLDVFQHEPMVPARLRELPNVVVLPHLGSATEETRTAMGNLVADNLEAFFGGRTPPHRVA